jgi:hypothetical protein
LLWINRQSLECGVHGSSCCIVSFPPPCRWRGHPSSAGILPANSPLGSRREAAAVLCRRWRSPPSTPRLRPRHRARPRRSNPPQADESASPRLPDSSEAIQKLAWADMKAIFAAHFASEINAVIERGGDAVLRERVAALDEEQQHLLREALAEVAI